MPKTDSALSQTFYQVRRVSRKIWVRSSAIAFLGIVAAAGSGIMAPLVPGWLAGAIKPEAVEKILEILASGMLAVVIFSLSVMLSARQSASQQVTPRSHQLLLEDPTTQNVLATFLGAFLFSLVGVITLGIKVYDGQSAAVILGFTILVIGLIVVAILRWISHLSDLGSVLETTRTVQRAAERAMATWSDTPCMNATPWIGPPMGVAEPAQHSGYVQHVDISELSDLAEDGDFELYLSVRPGTYVAKGQTLFHHTGAPDLGKLRHAISLGDARRFDQDPRFGVIVLTEIAQRALSPGINDPGTAIDVLTRHHALLSLFRDRVEADEDTVRHPRIHVRPLAPDALMQDAFDPIARDGDAMIEVQIRLQKVLNDLSRGGSPEFRQAVDATAQRALDRAIAALTLEADRDRLRDVVQSLRDAA